MSNYKDFVIVLVTHESYRTIGLALQDLKELNPKKIIVADANSEVFFRARAKEILQDIKIVESPFKKDKHTALLNALMYSLKVKTKYIVTIDADNYPSKKEIKDLMDSIKENDYILLSLQRKYLTRKEYIQKEFTKAKDNLLYKVHNRDPYTPTRVFKKSIAKKILDSKTPKQYAKNIVKIMEENKECSGFISYEKEKKKKKMVVEKKEKKKGIFLKKINKYEETHREEKETREIAEKETKKTRKIRERGLEIQKKVVEIKERIKVKVDLKKIKEGIKENTFKAKEKTVSFFKKTKSFLKTIPHSLKEILAIPNVKELKRKEQNLFVLSILLPLLLAYGVLHLYANPLGYWEKFEVEDREVQKTMNDFFSKSNVMYLDGITEVTVSPRTDRADVMAHVKIEGDENLYILEENIDKDEIKERMWSFEKKLEEEKEYHYLDEYEVKGNSRYISFKLEAEDDWHREIEKPELVLKYGQIQLIRHQDVFELRRTHYSPVVERVFQDIDKNEKTQNIVAVFKQPDKERDIRGFLSLYVNEKMSMQPLTNQIQNTNNNIDWEWNEYFKKDISQEYISLKQEEQIPQKEVENLDDDSCIKKSKEKKYTHTCKLADEFERMYDENERYVGSKQAIYQKEMFGNFNGEVKKISVGYDYPFEKKQEITKHYSRTPISIKIFGEMSEIKKLEITLYKESLW